jgi:hypothetical protein
MGVATTTPGGPRVNSTSAGMMRLTVALVGLAVFGALFAAIYYAPRNLEVRQEGAPVFQLAPGEAKQTVLQPTVDGTPVIVRLVVLGGPIDVFVMEKDWSDSLAKGGSLNLDRPFSFDAEHSRIGANGTLDLVLHSDGFTSRLLVFDHSDAYYEGDTVPGNATAAIRMTVTYVAEEARSLVLGYLAAIPSVLLVVVTFGRKARRLVRHRRRAD